MSCANDFILNKIVALNCLHAGITYPERAVAGGGQGWKNRLGNFDIIYNRNNTNKES